MTTIQSIEADFIEKGADLEHDRWARWQKYMFSKGTLTPEGDLIIPAIFVDRWFRQIDTKYADLSELEKESDRKETRNYLPLLREKLLSILDELVMEEKEIQKDEDRQEGKRRIYLNGYNDCRAELLSRIDKIKS